MKPKTLIRAACILAGIAIVAVGIDYAGRIEREMYAAHPELHWLEAEAEARHIDHIDHGYLARWHKTHPKPEQLK